MLPLVLLKIKYLTILNNHYCKIKTSKLSKLHQIKKVTSNKSKHLLFENELKKNYKIKQKNRKHMIQVFSLIRATFTGMQNNFA